MNGAFYIGATGLSAQQRALEVVANNIANLNTNSFKRSTARFYELAAAPSDPTAPGMAGVVSAAQAQGVAADTSPIDFTQGQLTQTGSAMDVAINGAGFIELLGPGGQSLLWRGGTLQVTPDGFLAASNGMELKGRLAVPSNTSALSIAQDGSVVATLSGGPATKTLGRIELVQAKDPTSLVGVTGGLYQAPTAGDLITSQAGEDGAGVLMQGSLETSNVNLTNEMVTLLLMQRAFSANSQVVQAGDQMMGVVNGLRR